MQLLVTGGTGRIGGNLVKALIDKGHDVRVFAVRSDKAAEKIKALGGEIFEGDLRSFDDCIAAVRGTKAIYHLGAYLPTPFDASFYARSQAEKTQILFDVNVRGTFNLLEAVALRCLDCRRFIMASTDATYPSGRPRDYAIDENTRQESGASMGMYSISKHVDEILVRGYQRQYNIPIVIFRFGSTLGIDEVLSKKMLYLMSTADLWITRLKEIKDPSEDVKRAIQELTEKAGGEERLVIPYHPEGWPHQHHICDVRDTAQGLVLGLERDAAVGEAFNLAGPAPFTYEEMIPYLSKAIGVPYFKAVLPVPGVRMELSIAKARTLLGYRPQYDVFRIIDDALRIQRGEMVEDFVSRGEPSEF
jgi:UDP-glucose 4-epimerase